MSVTATSHESSPATLAALPLGRAGMWWFLASEIMVFGGLLGSYVLARIAHGGWHEEMAHLNARIAALNTLVLVTSSLTIVLAHAAAERDDAGAARRYLWATVLLAAVFLCNKAYEYHAEIEHGFVPATSTFWSFYYAMTGLHGLHVIGGMVVNTALAVAAAGPRWRRVRHRVEYAGLYWHFVDVVWIFLFPLLYLS
jgi:heme/copper-type cytochrome/quinol oxidase subunit 3